MDLFSDKHFLVAIHTSGPNPRPVACGGHRFCHGRIATAVGLQVTQWQTDWFDGSLIKLLDRLLLFFIALEVFQNVTA